MNTSEGMDEISEDEEAGGEYIKGTRKKKNKDNEKQETQAQHPFKGNFVDFSG